MTANQIAYQNLLETQRANVVKENENARSNMAREYETNRSNLANEAIARERNAETQRANLASEFQKKSELEETKRANQAREVETNRANLANEEIKRATNTETAKHNRAMESLGYAQLNETAAHNRAVEEISATGNIVNFQTGMANAQAREYAADQQRGNVIIQTETTKSEGRKNRESNEGIARLQLTGTVIKTIGDVAGQVGGSIIRGLVTGGK